MTSEINKNPSSVQSILKPKPGRNNFTIIVTGGCGFIGSHTSQRLLLMGHRVIVIDNLYHDTVYPLEWKLRNKSILEKTYLDLHQQNGCSFSFYQEDISNEKIMTDIFKKEQPDIVCHLAARAGVRPSIDDPLSYVQTNTMGTINLMKISSTFHVRNFLYASSSSVYGSNSKVPFCENDEVVSQISPYALTKRACELWAKYFHQTSGLPITGFRFFTVYGERGRPDMAPYIFVDRIAKELPIKVFGDGKSARDYTYISDIVDGIMACIDTPRPNAIFNLGNSNPVPLHEFISIIEKSVGKSAIIEFLPEQPGDMKITYASIKKASKELNYQPKISLEEGINRLVEWYCESNPTICHGVPPSPPLSEDED